MGRKPREVGDASRYIAGELRAAKGRLNLTIDQIAEKSGLARATVGKSLQAERPIGAEELIVLAGALQLDPATLIREAQAASRPALFVVPDDDPLPLELRGRSVEELREMGWAAHTRPSQGRALYEESDRRGEESQLGGEGDDVDTP